jgi:hypothetical protein
VFSLGLIRVFHDSAIQTMLVVVLLAGCATHHSVTGRVVDSRGRPVANAMVSASALPPDWIKHQPIGTGQRFEVTSSQSDGSFSFFGHEHINYVEAISRDSKKRGVLSRVAATDNIVVIR